LESFDGGIEGRQLPFRTIAPEPQHRQLAFLMLAAQSRVIGAGAAAERMEHVSESNRFNPDGFPGLVRCSNHLAMALGGTTVWEQFIHTVVLTSLRTPQQHAA
jgi:hypothetical protein